MAISSPYSNSSLFFSLKVALISVAVLCLGLVLSLYLPVIVTFVVSELPAFWLSLRSWLTPPYLYVIINCIIITIAASSKFQKKVEHATQFAEVTVPVKLHQDFPSPQPMYEDKTVVSSVDFVPPVPEVYETVGPVEVVQEFEVPVAEAEVYTVENDAVKPSQEEEVGREDYEMVVSSADSGTDSMDMEIPAEYLFSKEKPPVSLRFGHHRKIVRGNPEAGKALKVSRQPKRHDTLETTWKMITEGRSIPLARHLKKSDTNTWETYSRSLPQEPLVQKADTFNDRSTHHTPLTRSSGSGKIKKEPSLGQDELNRKVEAFIKKFNEEMRLQRLESLNQYKEMLNGGGH